jgi:hypothetical protein
MEDSNEALKRAQESFRKQRGKAPPAYEAEARAIREKTARLKALRLAKAATEKKEEVSVKPGKPR